MGRAARNQGKRPHPPSLEVCTQRVPEQYLDSSADFLLRYESWTSPLAESPPQEEEVTWGVGESS